MLTELESQQSRENAELASYVGTLVPSRAQTLIPEMLSEIFLQCNIPSPQEWMGGPLNVEMWTNINILRVCSAWWTAALNTPALWSELLYGDAGTLPLEFYNLWLSRAGLLPLNLNIWATFGCGEDSYWSGAAKILHTHCNALGTLKLKLPPKDSFISVPSLFDHPHQPTNLRNLTIHSYDDYIHKTLTNIPWNQLSSLEFRVRYENRFISPTQLAGILAQTVRLTRLLANLGPDPRFSPSPPRVLCLPRLHTLDISWGAAESPYDGTGIPHSFINLFDKLSAPALKSLKLGVGKEASAFVLPALTNLVARCAVGIELLHCDIEMWCPISPAVSPLDTIIGLLQETPSLISFHWGSDGCDLPDLVEALTHTEGSRTRILPKLVDISLRLDNSSRIRRHGGIASGIRLAIAAPNFSLKTYRHIPWDDYDDIDHFELPSLSSDSRTANEHALQRLEEFTTNGLGGSVDFRHFDQTLKLADPKAAVRQPQVWVIRSKVSGNNSLYCDDDMVWHWVDAQTLSRQQQL
ncbi:hypothetical protein K438DRAFT_2062618 [Mycena galopus ATCC 62051]|nr:hypothetical protein K438DRAFT_2062618 [Mycena galopus ATCC 62051]